MRLFVRVIACGLFIVACRGDDPGTPAPSPGRSSAAESSADQGEARWLDRIPAAERHMSAAALNKTGFELYERKNFEAAADYFGAAAEKDDGLAVAHYNLACALSILAGQGKTPPANLIVRHLHRAWRLAPAYRGKMKADVDLDPVRAVPAFCAWVERLDDPEFEILSLRFPEAYFQFEEPFMYRDRTAVLRNVRLGGRSGFIPLDTVRLLKMPEFRSALVCNVFFCGEAGYRLLQTKAKAQEGETAPFGDIGVEGLENSLYVVFYDASENRIDAESEERGWRASLGLGAGLET